MKKSPPKEKKLVDRLPRLSSPKEKGVTALPRLSAPPSVKKPPAPNPLPPPEHDILAAVVKKHETVAAQVDCMHKHLKFANMGSAITCIDCPKRWTIGLDTAPLVPDLGYFHPALNETETRHSPFEAPRLAPLPTKAPGK